MAGVNAIYSLNTVLLFSADVQLLGQSHVALEIIAPDICQQPSALTDHFKQTAARGFIVLMISEMVSQLADPLGQNSDLYFG